MAAVKSPLPEEVRHTAGHALQGALVDLVDLALSAKQAHWNVTGRTFKSIHQHLDELVLAVREASDAVAERSVTIGVNPDGRVRTIAHDTRLPQLEPGYLPEDKVIAVFIQSLAEVIARFRARITETEREPVTQDLLLGITAELEKHHWMFSVQQ